MKNNYNYKPIIPYFLLTLFIVTTYYMKICGLVFFSHPYFLMYVCGVLIIDYGIFHGLTGRIIPRAFFTLCQLKCTLAAPKIQFDRKVALK